MASLVLAGAALMLSACATNRPLAEADALFAEGKSEAGLAVLEQAVRAEPANVQYRMALVGRRAALVNRLLASGETARREGRLSDAEKAYAQVLVHDPNHAMARQGQEAVAMERGHRQLVGEAEALFKQATPAAVEEALGKLHRVLTGNPNHKEALNLRTRINDFRAKQPRPEARLAEVYRKPITLEFRDAPLKSVFDFIAKVSGLNFFFDKDIRPDLKATILARNTSIEDAVRLLMVTNQLEQKVLNSNSVLIYPSTPQKLKEYQTLAVRTFFLANADVKAVSNTIKTIVKTKDLVIDERLGLIIVRDTPEAIRIAERIVALQDISDPEVMLEVEVMEIKRSRLLELGVQWPGSMSLAPLQASGTSLTLDALRNLSGSTIQATVSGVTINANKQDQDTNTLANPRIRVRNKEKAKVLIGDRVPIITTTSATTGFVSESVNYVDVGLKLEVEPNIYLDDEVAIKVNLEVSTLGAQTLSKAGSVTYQIGTRGATTVLRLKDGETQILAGLINDDDRTSASKVPGLGEMPIVGRLFGSERDDRQRSEILLSITPRVMRSIRRPDLLSAEFESGTEANVGADTLRVSTIEDASPAAAAAPATRPANSPAAAPGPAVVAAAAPNPGGPAAAAPVPPRPAATAAMPAAVAAPAAAAMAGSTRLNWQVPAQVRGGEQFSAVLQLSSQAAVRGVPVLVGFDPQVLQVVSVVEGDYLRQGNGRTTFSHRIDSAQGKIFVAAVRQGADGSDAGVNGNGSLVTITFKAVKPGAQARLQLLSASPEPPPAQAVAMPVEALVRIAP